uniref:shufflon system plasmid conjugative transfer pilus tip adhesin PilV n=1 Tax=Methylobacter sp. BBA5.1 TaxID=1495064 RepID=UPI001267F19C
GYARMAGEAQKQTRDTVTAQHFKAVLDASTRYIQDNWAIIQANATPTAPAVITTAMLSATGYLPAGFNGTNPYGQTLRTEVLEPSAGNLQATVISMAGNAIPAGQAPRIAAKVGAGGGYTPTATPTTAQGGIWRLVNAVSKYHPARSGAFGRFAVL